MAIIFVTVIKCLISVSNPICICSVLLFRSKMTMMGNGFRANTMFRAAGAWCG